MRGAGCGKEAREDGWRLETVSWKGLPRRWMVRSWASEHCSQSLPTFGLRVGKATDFLFHSFPGVCSNSCPLSWWCHPTVSSSVIPFSSCPQSFLASRSFPLSWLFPPGGQSIGASASASVLPMNIHNWFPLGRTGWISLQSKGFSRVFSNTTVQKHQYYSAIKKNTFESVIMRWKNPEPRVQSEVRKRKTNIVY